MRTVTAVCLSLLCAAVAVPQDALVKKGLDRLQGKWKVVDCKAIEQFEVELAKMAVFEIRGDKLTIKFELPPGAKKDSSAKGLKELLAMTISGTIKIDPTKKPSTLEFKIVDAKNKGSQDVNKSIYEIDGDTLKMHRSYSNVYPKDFAYEKGKTVLSILKRVAK